MTFVSGFVKSMRWIPTLFVTGVILWSYYAYVVELCILTVSSNSERVAYLIIYHPLMMLFVWSYWQAVMTEPHYPKQEYFLSAEEQHKIENATTEEEQSLLLRQVARNLHVHNRTIGGSYRYCHITKCIKPDRAHYCSVTKRVVLKMDHFCPWVNNCVSWSNYKFFMLFLFYALMYCLFVCTTSFKYSLLFWKDELKDAQSARFHILFIFLVGSMFSFSVSVLFFYHMYLVFYNMTTLESFRSPVFANGIVDKRAYNLGRRKNFEEVFGTNAKLWLLPVFTSLGDGHVFPLRSQREQDLERNYNHVSSSSESDFV